MAHLYSSTSSRMNNTTTDSHISCNSLNIHQHTHLSNHQNGRHVSIMYPNHHSQSTNEQKKEVSVRLNSPMKYEGDFIPIDDFSNGFTYKSHLGRFCKNVIIVSARHPHSFFLQTVDDLTYSDNFFSKMNEFYNHCIDAQRLVVSKAAMRVNLCCVARDETEPDVWNRAQLLEYHSETDLCSLLLVDLGTWQECVPRAKLRHILIPFRQECVRTVSCRLAGIAPAKPEKNGLWNEYAIKTFRNVIDNVPTEVEVLDRLPNGTYFVNLFVTHDTFVCVNDFLLYHKIAIAIDDFKSLKPEEFDPFTHEPLLAIVYEFNLQGKLLAEEIKTNQIQQKEHQHINYEKRDHYGVPCIRVVPISTSSSPCKKIIFARYNNWIMIPWFSISTMFNPPLSERTIERFALLYRFPPVKITTLAHPVLFVQLQKLMTTTQNDNKERHFRGHEITIALYSIDYVRKLLLNHNCNNDFIFEQLNEAREAESSKDDEFWERTTEHHQSLMRIKQSDEENKLMQEINLLKIHKNQLEYRLAQTTMSNPDYQQLQRQLVDTMEKLSLFSNDSNSSC